MMENGNYKITIESRITRLEVQIQDIVDNHLKHLSEKVDRIQWLIVTTLVAILVSLARNILGG